MNYQINNLVATLLLISVTSIGWASPNPNLEECTEEAALEGLKGAAANLYITDCINRKGDPSDELAPVEEPDSNTEDRMRVIGPDEELEKVEEPA